MLKPINSIIKDSIGNIMFRGNVVTGIVATDNSDGSYDVFISESDRAYPKIFTLSRNPDLVVGDKVRILYKNGCKELPIIIKPTGLTLFENQPDISVYTPGIKLATTYFGQHFTVESNHTVERIDLLLGKENETQTGTAYIDLYNADVSGHPTGEILATGELDTSTIDWVSGTAGGATVWNEITLSNSVSLTSGNKMVIVIRFPGADSTHWVSWAQVSKTDGRGIRSRDSGSTWSRLYGTYPKYCDFTFKIYGR